MGLLSFDDYSGDKKPLDENKKLKRSEKRKNKKIQEKVESSQPDFRKLKNTPKKNLKEIGSKAKVNENAFQVGDNYKVKIVIDVPVSLVKQYSDKVSQDTGKNALENFSESELAEQMVDYIVKQNLNIDSVPTSVAVGEEVIEEDDIQVEEIAKEDADTLEGETSTDNTEEVIEEEPAEEETTDEEADDGLLSMTDDDITFEDDEEEGSDENNELEFEAEEKELGEEIEVEEEDKSEEEEESLDGMFQNILKK